MLDVLLRLGGDHIDWRTADMKLAPYLLAIALGYRSWRKKIIPIL